MRALLLSAGYGKRLRPITDNIPKCLLPINEKPLLQYWIEMLTASGIKQILINTHYLANKVEVFISNSPYKKYVTLVYEEKLLGTGGTLLKNRIFFEGDSIMLIHADNLSLFNIKDFIRRHKERPQNVEITMMVFNTDSPKECGIVGLNEAGIVTKFYEKVNENHGNLANAAVFIIEPSVINYISSLGKEIIDFSKEVIPRYLGKILSYPNEIYHRDIGTPISLQKAQIEFPPIFKQYLNKIYL